MIELLTCTFDELWDSEKEAYDFYDESDLDIALFFVVRKEGKSLFVKCDLMQPEDARFNRDLKWVPELAKLMYNQGLEEGFLNK